MPNIALIQAVVAAKKFIKPVARSAVVKEIIFPKYENELKPPECHPEINNQDFYVALIDGLYYSGKFSFPWKDSRGHANFNDGWGNCGHQFDPPGTNGCSWQKVWKVINTNGLRHGEAILLAAGLDPVQIAMDSEMNYAHARRNYCIKHGMTYKNRPITEESPIEAWLYKPTKPTMPPSHEDDEDEDC